MNLRCLVLAIAMALAACAHVPQTLPSPLRPGSETRSLSVPSGSRTWYVDGKHGSDKNDCTSRQSACKTILHAISLTSRGDSIIVAPATYPENLAIHHSLKIFGSGAATTIVDGGGVASEIITFNPATFVTVSGMTMRDGGGQGDGSGIYNCTATVTITDSIISANVARRGPGELGYGGGIYNCPGSTMTIVDSTLRGNKAEAGGAICNGGTLTITGSTISDNVAREHRGGGIFNYGSLTIDDSTFSGNSVRAGNGGGINNGELFGQKGMLVIDNSTLGRNTAGDGTGSGIFNLSGATAMLQNSIVSGDSGKNCGGTLISKGYNLSNDGTCDFKNAGDLNNTDPKLGPLQDNGGPTETMALQRGSPAVDAGNPNGCTDGRGRLFSSDQRGLPRPDREDSSGCDIGAYERQTD